MTQPQEDVPDTIPGPMPYPEEPRRYGPDQDPQPDEEDPDERPGPEEPVEPDIHPQPLHAPIK